MESYNQKSKTEKYDIYPKLDTEEKHDLYRNLDTEALKKKMDRIHLRVESAKEKNFEFKSSRDTLKIFLNCLTNNMDIIEKDLENDLRSKYKYILI